MAESFCTQYWETGLVLKITKTGSNSGAVTTQKNILRDADKSLARPTSQCRRTESIV